MASTPYNATPLEQQIMKHVRYLRRANDVTTSDMGELIGMTQSAYSNQENGRIHLTIEKLERIASVFNCTVLDLIKEATK